VRIVASRASRVDLPRAGHLLSALQLHSLLNELANCIESNGNLTLFEVGCGTPEAFMSSHIPGAHYIDTQTLETLPFWNAIDDTGLLTRLASLGVQYNTTVILYGRNQCAAARVAHLMLYAGVQDVRLLDGGGACWQAAGLACASGLQEPPLPVPSFGLDAPANPHFKISLAQAQAIANAEAASEVKRTLVSIRTREEHTGLTSGYSYITAKGDIPGALWGHAGKGGDVNDMCDFQHPDGTMRSAADISALWAQCGIHRDMNIAFYCGTGWRASLAFFYAWLMGWERISVFDGGWLEWSHSGAMQDS
jgi:thiosulfate/3-mercaptopyruvate sulfurtransferase